MKLYTHQAACSLSPHIISRELGLDVEIIRVDRATHRTSDGKDYLAINPQGLNFGYVRYEKQALGQEQKDPTHTSNFGVKLQERCKSVGVDCELVYPGAPGVKHRNVQGYLIAKLKSSGG